MHNFAWCRVAWCGRFCLRFATVARNEKEGRKEGRMEGRHLSLVGREGIGGAQGVLPRCMYKLNTVYIREGRRLEARRATWRRWRLPLPSSIMRTMTNRGSKARAASVASERASERVTSCLGLLSLSLSLSLERAESEASLYLSATWDPLLLSLHIY